MKDKLGLKGFPGLPGANGKKGLPGKIVYARNKL